MRLSGIQYYWLVGVGLIFGQVFSILVGVYESQIEASITLTLLTIFGVIYPSICYYTVLLEIWSRIRFKLVLVFLLIFFAAAFVHPFFLALITVGPTIYWFSRINGYRK